VGGPSCRSCYFSPKKPPEGGYTARALGASIFTEADTLDELREQVRDAVYCHFDEGERSAVSFQQSGDDRTH